MVPIGFMDLTGVWRDKNAASSIGTNFGSVPLNNAVSAKNSEFRFSPQNSRIGFRIDGDWKGAHFIGYNEFDFLGTSGATNLTVTNGAFVPRLRLFWVDVRKGKVEFLAGQSWSMLTPGRIGISPLPGDLFYSQVIDVNYMAGLTWTRQPGVRVLIHPSNKVTFGLSFENPDQYMGGAKGGSAAVLPTALTSLATTQLDNGGSISGTSTVLSTPTVMPDIIAKLAFDPSSRFHFEVGGIASQYKIWNLLTGTAPGAGQHFSTTGSGVQVGINAGITKNFRLITTNFFDDGEGRYLFGQAPDVIVRSNGALSAVHSAGTVDGFEATVKKTLIVCVLRRDLHRPRCGARCRRKNSGRLWLRQIKPKPRHSGRHLRLQPDYLEKCELWRHQSYWPIRIPHARSLVLRHRSSGRQRDAR